MKKILSFWVSFVAVCFQMVGQNVLFEKIQTAKELYNFEDISVLNFTTPDDNVLNNFLNPDKLFFLDYFFESNTNNLPEAINFTIPNGEEQVILELLEVPTTFYNYPVVTSEGDTFPANQSIRHYRGIVQGKENSIAAISISADELFGMFATDEGNYNLSKLQSGKYVLYNDRNLKESSAWECGTNEEFLFNQNSQILRASQNALTVNGDKVVRLYFETEDDIYTAKGSSASVASFVSAIFNQVRTLYENENIITELAAVYIWTSNDPYTGASTTSLLTQFQNYRTSFDGDLGMLLTFRSVGGGEAAGFSGLCNSSARQKLAVAMLYNNSVVAVPVYSWNVQVVTHEFGHLFGSRHTHACVWNGNNTAIDGCAGVTEGGCSLPSYPSGGGTIMSYCHLSGRPGIKFNLGFGQQPGNVIRNSVLNSECLSCANSILANQTITSSVSVSSCCDMVVQNVTVNNSASLTVSSSEPITLQPGFHAVAGSNFHASIEPCSYTSLSMPAPSIVVEDYINNFSRTKSIDSPLSLSVFPNPANDWLHINYSLSTNSSVSIELVNFLGRNLNAIFSVTKQAAGEYNFSLPVSSLSSGVYFLIVTINGQKQIKKIVIN
ncbi:MAG: M12 family metallo-peptidase [Candidatus Symbiothrix sp.]|jgi:hypothetical protein|nr:M12 family metallo-peptidase [Candidatus Symbiothrix sp.]